MNEQAQRIAIAEFCGWQHPAAPYHLIDAQMAEPPDYLHDLNAMHDAETRLMSTPIMVDEYWRKLGYVRPHPIYATAAQRAEALLRTIGKWQQASSA